MKKIIDNPRVARTPQSKPVVIKNKQSPFVSAIAELKTVFDQLKESPNVKNGTVEIKESYFNDDDMRPMLTSWGPTGVRSIDIRPSVGSGNKHTGWVIYNRKERKKCFVYIHKSEPLGVRVVHIQDSPNPKDKIHVVKNVDGTQPSYTQAVANVVAGYMLAVYTPGLSSIPEEIKNFKEALVKIYRNQIRFSVFKHDEVPAVYRKGETPFIFDRSYEIAFNTSAVPRFLFVKDHKGDPLTYHMGLVIKPGELENWTKFSFNKLAEGVLNADTIYAKMIEVIKRKVG